MKNCTPFQNMLTAHALGELNAQQTRQLESHLADCHACRNESAQMQTVLNIADSMKSQTASEQMCVSITKDIQAISKTTKTEARNNISWSRIIKSKAAQGAIAAVLILGVSLTWIMLSGQPNRMSMTPITPVTMENNIPLDNNVLPDQDFLKKRSETELELAEYLFTSANVNGLSSLYRIGLDDTKLAVANYLSDLERDDAFKALKALDTSQLSEKSRQAIEQTITEIEQRRNNLKQEELTNSTSVNEDIPTEIIHETVNPERNNSPLIPGRTIKALIVDNNSNRLEGVQVCLWEEEVEEEEGMADASKVLASSDENGQISLIVHKNIYPYFAFSKPGYISLKEVHIEPVDDYEYFIVMYPQISISGTVEDALTGKPIQNYSIMGRSKPGRYDAKKTHYGTTTFTHTIDNYHLGSFAGILEAHHADFWLDIKADGYLMQESEIWPIGTSEVSCSVKLTPCPEIEVTVLGTNGLPAANTTVEFKYAFRPVDLRKPDIIGVCDENGSYRLTDMPTKGPFPIIASNESGYGFTVWDETQSELLIQLQAWATLEGNVVGINITPENNEVNLESRSEIRTYFSGTIDNEGHFLFEKVPPGVHSIVCLRRNLPVQLEPGENRTIQIGQTGTSVRGRILLPEQFTDPDNPVIDGTQWKCGQVHLSGEKKELAEGIFLNLSYSADREDIEPNGVFTIPEIVPGKYEIQADFFNGNNKIHGRPKIIIPEADDPNTVVDIGDIPLEPWITICPGLIAPDFEVPCFDGSVFRLSEHTGKVVLLHFWRTDQPEKLAAVHDLVSVHEDHPGFVALSLAVDSREYVEDIVRERDLFWNQASCMSKHTPGVSRWSDPRYAWFMKHYGRPQMIKWCLIGPDGRIITIGRMNKSPMVSEVSKAMKALEE